MRRQSKQFAGVVLATAAIGVVFFELTKPEMEPRRRESTRKEVDISYATTIATTTELYNERLKAFKDEDGNPAASTLSDSLNSSSSPSSLWPTPRVPARLQTARWDDPELIEHIRDEWIIKTGDTKTDESPSYAKEDYSQAKQAQIIDRLLRHRTDAFFVECGAADGVKLSDTFFLEKERNWTGLLIEAEPTLFAELLRSSRRGFLTNACVSPSTSASVLRFAQVKDTLLSGLVDYIPASHRQRMGEARRILHVQCFPLASILRAIDVSHVDFMSLDVEGSELEILKSLPEKGITIETLSVEYRIIGDVNGTDSKLKKIRELMVDDRGYKEMAVTSNLDIILMKKKSIK